MNDKVTCFECGMVLDSDLAVHVNNIWFCSKKHADSWLARFISSLKR